MKMEFVDEAELQKAADEPEDEVRGVKAVLSAAALTYVAAALQAVLQLLRLILISGNSRRRD